MPRDPSSCANSSTMEGIGRADKFRDLRRSKWECSRGEKVTGAARLCTTAFSLRPSRTVSKESLDAKGRRMNHAQESDLTWSGTQCTSRFTRSSHF
jgi:hypothetical protein